MSRLTRTLDSWVNHPSLDYLVLSVALAVAVVVNPADLLLSEQHGDWYQTLAGVNGVLVGVAGVAVTLLFTVPPNDRLQRVLATVGPRFGLLVMSCIGALVVTTAGFALLFLLETANHRSRVAATAGLLTFAVLRAGRLWRLFVSVIVILSTPDAGFSQPDPGAPWKRPVIDPGDYTIGRRPVRRARSTK